MNWGARKSSVFGRSDQIEQRIVPILYARYFKYTCYSVYYSVGVCGRHALFDAKPKPKPKTNPKPKPNLNPNPKSNSKNKMEKKGNPELYDPTDTCRPTSRPTNGRQSGD